MTSRRLAAAHVFADDLDAPILAEEDRHHLGRVLRFRVGEIVSVSNGTGAWRLFSVANADLDLSPISDVDQVERPRVGAAVAFSLTKGERPELVVQKLTELGIDHIIPVFTERTIVRWDSSKMERNHERLVKVVREAAMQSRAVFLPRVHHPVHGLGELIKLMTDLGMKDGMALAEPDGEPISDVVTSIMIGPEGGFTPEECVALSRHVVLPGGILRAETAAIAAGVLLAHQRSVVHGYQP
jgi:16S rRNA (uracil1498-N3)-methyltransferase